MSIGIIGGGINGLCCAWVLAKTGQKVVLYARGKIANETSRASTKLLHGGLRYLEQFNAYNYYKSDSISEKDISEIFSGVRPLLKSHGEPNKMTREYAIERMNKLTTVYGGKWTTSYALAEKVAKIIV